MLIQGYAISRMPITLGQWSELFDNRMSPDERRLARRQPMLPVTGMSWIDAIEFCRKVAEAGGLRRLSDLRRMTSPPDLQYDRQGTISLPTEAEWEFACRAGTRTAFSVGDTLPLSMANHSGSTGDDEALEGKVLGRRTKVGHYPPNEWGLHDMYGNVWEWCLDAYGPYEVTEGHHEQPRINPVIVDEPLSQREVKRVVRGGSFLNSQIACRSAYRGYFDEKTRNEAVGFRVVWIM